MAAAALAITAKVVDTVVDEAAPMRHHRHTATVPHRAVTTVHHRTAVATTPRTPGTTSARASLVVFLSFFFSFFLRYGQELSATNQISCS